MKKLLLITTILFFCTTLYLGYLWLDLVVTRNYELESEKVMSEAYVLSAKLLENELRGQNIELIVKKLNVHSMSLGVHIIDKTYGGDGELWFGSVRFKFQENVLVSVGDDLR